MYLDTDIILALAKKEDWLKKHVSIDKIQPARTSVFAIIEAQLVLEREYSRQEALQVLSAVQKLMINLLPFDERVLSKSQELLREHPQLNIFDSVHAAFALVHQDLLVSTDTVYPTIPGLNVKDPRAM